MRKIIGFFGAAVIAAAGLSACSNAGTSYEDDYDGLCKQNSSQVRVDDDFCEDRLSGYSRVKLKKGQKAPKMGEKFTSSTSDDAKKDKKKSILKKKKDKAKAKSSFKSKSKSSSRSGRR